MSTSTILIVEDNPVTRKMVRVALESERYTVLDAGDAKTALDLMARYRPDLVLQDLLLPDMDGLELVRRLRALPHAAAIPVLALSGLLTPEEQDRSLQAGFTDYLCKPVRPSQLVGTVQAYLLSAAAAGTASAATSSARAGQGRRILITDDDPIQLKLLKIHVEQLGFQVTTADNGVGALDQARRFRPDAVVSDVLMPGLDGFRFCQALRQDPEIAHIPVVLVSASYVEEEDQRLAEIVGANALVLRTPELRDVTEALLTSLSQEDTHPPAAARPRAGGSLQGGLDPEPEGRAVGESLPREYTQRTVQQLERQVNLNADLSDRLAWLEGKFAILTGIAETVKSGASLETVVDELLHQCLDAAGVPRGIAYLCQPDGPLALRAQLGYHGAAEIELPEFFGHFDMLHSVMAAGDPVSTASTSFDEELLARASAQSMLITPLVLGDECLGVLVMSAANGELDDEWLPFARLVGSQIGQAIGLARAFCQLKESEEKKKWFHREVIRAVTHDKLHLVDPEEIPANGCPVLDLPCEVPTDCRPLREQLREVADDAGMHPEVAEDLILAAAEGATNAIKHAVEGRCSVYVASDRVIARVTDRGRGIDAEALPASLLLPGFSTQVSLGMGFTMMLKLAERIWLATGPEGTVLQIEKWIDPQQHLEAQLLAAWE